MTTKKCKYFITLNNGFKGDDIPTLRFKVTTPGVDVSVNVKPRNEGVVMVVKNAPGSIELEASPGSKGAKIKKVDFTNSVQCEPIEKQGDPDSTVWAFTITQTGLHDTDRPNPDIDPDEASTNVTVSGDETFPDDQKPGKKCKTQ
ncbi:MAG: hypothetical protein GY940_12350 [bacterium]|nr:hypothetical protein [bacterium]